MMRAALLSAAALLLAAPAAAQGLDLSRGGPISVLADDGIEWRQTEKQVVARGNARATREGVTVTADRLTAWYRPKPGAAPQPGQGAEAEASEVYRLTAEGRVRIFTADEQATGDRAVFDVDEAVLVLTGRDLRLTTPKEQITAKESLEYWSQKRMAVARGGAAVTTQDARRVGADTLVAYLAQAPAAGPTGGRAAANAADRAGKLERVDAFGSVSVRTPTDTATGDRGVYVPELGVARLGGTVRITTRGNNQLNGSLATVNMKTGVARLESARGDRVKGLIVPNDPAVRGSTAQAPDPAPRALRP